MLSAFQVEPKLICSLDKYFDDYIADSKSTGLKRQSLILHRIYNLMENDKQTNDEQDFKS